MPVSPVFFSSFPVFFFRPFALGMVSGVSFGLVWDLFGIGLGLVETLFGVGLEFVWGYLGLA